MAIFEQKGPKMDEKEGLLIFLTNIAIWSS